MCFKLKLERPGLGGFANVWWFPIYHILQCLCAETSALSVTPPYLVDLSTGQLLLQHHGQCPPTTQCFASLLFSVPLLMLLPLVPSPK